MNGYRMSSRGDEKLTVAMAVQLCEYPRNHLKWVTQRVCGLYLNRSIIFEFSRRGKHLSHLAREPQSWGR